MSWTFRLFFFVLVKYTCLRDCLWFSWGWRTIDIEGVFVLMCVKSVHCKAHPCIDWDSSKQSLLLNQALNVWQNQIPSLLDIGGQYSEIIKWHNLLRTTATFFSILPGAISSEEIIKYAHRISASNAVCAPLTWVPGNSCVCYSRFFLNNKSLLISGLKMFLYSDNHQGLLE